MAKSSRLGGVTNLQLRFGRHEIRVASDSRKAIRLLEAALGDHVVEPGDGADLAFLLHRPRSLQRSHFLNDRSGFVLSTNRGLDSGVAALAGHLTAYLPPLPGCVRVRSRALKTEAGVVVGLPPALLVPRLDEKDLARVNAAMVDCLAIDIDIKSGRIRQAAVPWPELELAPGPGHAGVACDELVSSVLTITPEGSTHPTRADVVAGLAGNALEGTPSDVLDACCRLVESCELRVLAPTNEASEVLEVLRSGDRRE